MRQEKNEGLNEKLKARPFPSVLDAHFQLAFQHCWARSRLVFEHQLRYRLAFEPRVGGNVSVATRQGYLTGSIGFECLY